MAKLYDFKIIKNKKVLNSFCAENYQINDRVRDSFNALSVDFVIFRFAIRIIMAYHVFVSWEKVVKIWR